MLSRLWVANFFIVKYRFLWYNYLAMKNKTHLYVSIKNVLTWIMVLCMASSVVTRILFVGMKGADLWSQVLLPTAAAVIYALIITITGKERFYKSALPVWLMSIYYCFRFAGFSFGTHHIMIVSLYVIAMLFIAVLYTQITAGKAGLIWLLVPVMLIPACAVAYLDRSISAIPDAFMSAGVSLTMMAVKIHPLGEYHPTWGDRIDGRRVRTLPPMAQISPYFMVQRNESSNYITIPIEITPVERYIRQKRREGLTNFGITHVLLVCYCRAIAKFPAVNRFLAGQRVYSRGNDIQFCMIAKKEMSTDSPDSSIKLHLTPYATAEDVYNQLNTAVEKIKNTPLNSDFDKTAAAFSLIPGVLLKFVIWLLKLLDYFGMLPKFLMEVSPFHGSVFFTSMGSLGIPPIYHHLYNFGNLPVFCAFGAKRKELEIQEDGSVVQRKYVDLTAVTDERICDGFYYAAFMKHFTRLLRHPEQFDSPPDEVVADVD